MAKRSRARRRLAFTPRKRHRGPVARKRRRYGAGRTSARGFVKKVALSLAESKVRHDNHLGTGLLHNVIKSFNLIDNEDGNPSVLPTQGAADNQRNGSDIYATGIMIRGHVDIPFDRRNAKFKMWLVERNSIQGSVNTYGDFFKTVTGAGALDPINDDKFKVKYLGQLRTVARDLYIERGEITDAGADASVYFKKWIPFKRKLKFSGTDAKCTQGMKEFLTLNVLPYDTYTTAETDIIGRTWDMAVSFYYKDP